MAEKLNIQQFESRPVAAEAILWDGTRKSAKKIIKWLASQGFEGVYNDNTRFGSNGELDENITISIINSNAILCPNFWLVKQEQRDIYGKVKMVLTSFNTETFADNFRIKA